MMRAPSYWPRPRRHWLETRDVHSRGHLEPCRQGNSAQGRFVERAPPRLCGLQGGDNMIRFYDGIVRGLLLGATNYTKIKLN